MTVSPLKLSKLKSMSLIDKKFCAFKVLNLTLRSGTVLLSKTLDTTVFRIFKESFVRVFENSFNISSGLMEIFEMSTFSEFCTLGSNLTTTGFSVPVMFPSKSSVSVLVYLNSKNSPLVEILSIESSSVSKIQTPISGLSLKLCIKGTPKETIFFISLKIWICPAKTFLYPVVSMNSGANGLRLE